MHPRAGTRRRGLGMTTIRNLGGNKTAAASPPESVVSFSCILSSSYLALGSGNHESLISVAPAPTHRGADPSSGHRTVIRPGVEQIRRARCSFLRCYAKSHCARHACGELVVWTGDRLDFDALQEWNVNTAGSFVVFDVLLSGRALTAARNCRLPWPGWLSLRACRRTTSASCSRWRLGTSPTSQTSLRGDEHQHSPSLIKP